MGSGSTSGRRSATPRPRSAIVRVAQALLVVAALGACDATTASGPSAPGSTPRAGGEVSTSTTAPPPPPATPDHPVRVEAIGVLLGRPGEALMICESVKLSDPPQCSGPPLVVDEADVPGLVGAHSAIDPVETTSSTRLSRDSFRYTRSQVRVVGDWNSEALTPTEPITEVEATRPPPGSSPFPVPCDPSEGAPGSGTLGATSGTAADTGEDPGSVQSLVQAEPDFAGFWVSGTVYTADGLDPSVQVPVVAFTGDLAAHEASIREVYDGPLCVIGAQFTEKELNDTMAALSTDPEARRRAGTGAFGGGADVASNQVHVRVTFADRETVGWFQDRAPEGMVVVDGWFRPMAAGS